MNANIVKRMFPLREFPGRTANRLRMTRFVQRALAPFGRILKPDKWIFVIGCYNSGTTLLERLLASHPEIGSLDFLGQHAEGVDLTYALPRPEDFGWTKMWCKCLNQVRIEPNAGMADRAELIKGQWSIWFPKDTPILVEKSIANATRMPFLQEYFQPAYFIHIIRNGYAVAEGIRRKGNPRRWKNSVYQSSYPIELCAEQWRVSDELVVQASDKIKRLMQIYYEDLTAEPQKVLKQVTDFIDLDNLPESIFLKPWNVHRVISPITNMNGQSYERLSDQDIATIQRVAGFRLTLHGYEPPRITQTK